jgi:hypothetical protein
MDNLAIVLPPGRAEYDQLLGDEITLLAGQLNAGSYRLIKLIGRFDDCKAWQCGIALGAARERVRVAHCLQNLPLIDASFASGEISFSKVRAMTRVATPDNEDYLLMIAQHGTASHVEQVVRKYRNVCCANEDRAELEVVEKRQCVYYQQDDGSWVIHARLSAEAGALVAKAIEAVANHELEEQQEQKDVPAGTLSQVDDAAQHDNKSVPADRSPAVTSLQIDDPAEHQKTYRQARADALVKMAEHFIATCGQAGVLEGLRGAEHCQVMLHVDIDTLRGHREGQHKGPGCCNLDEKHWISAKTAQRLSCDASLVTVLENDRGQVLNIGRRSRTVPPAIKRALSLRDKTCRVPGCCQSRNLDAHHIQHWSNGGETSLDNLVHLCRRHHTQLHQGLFSIAVHKAIAEDQARFVFSTPSGQRIEASMFPQFSQAAVASSQEALSNAAPGVDASTCVTHWSGETCDYSMAMDGLLKRDGMLTRAANENEEQEQKSPVK